MSGCACVGNALANRVTDPALRRLLSLHSSAVRDFVEARLALQRARRAELVLEEGAGIAGRLRARAHAEACAELFGQAQRAVGAAVAALGADRRDEMDALLANGGLQRIGASARARALLALIEADCSATEAQEALGSLDEGLRIIGDINSTEAAAQYLDERFNQLSDASRALQEPRDDRRELCILILLIFSLYITAIVLFVIACEAHISCNIANELENWLNQECGPLSTSGLVG